MKKRILMIIGLLGICFLSACTTPQPTADPVPTQAVESTGKEDMESIHDTQEALTATPEPVTEPTKEPEPTAEPTKAPEPTTIPTAIPTPTEIPTPTPVAVTWISTWATAEQTCSANGAGPTDSAMPKMALEGTTVRQIIRVTTSGAQIRFRLSNEYGECDTEILSLHIAKQSKDALADGTGISRVDMSTIDETTDTVVTVNGQESFVIPKGEVILTDAVDFSVDALDNIAVTSYFGKTPTVNITGHRGARATTYQVTGNHVSETVLTGYQTTTSWFFLADASVFSPEGSKAIVCFGDSITDGYGTDASYLGKRPDSYTRWVDYFAKRLQENETTKYVSVLNEGIGSNAFFGNYPTDAGKDRFERDLLEHDGVAYCIILFGVNDLNKLSNTSKYDLLVPEYEKMIALCHENNIKVYAAPIMPFGDNAYYSEASEQVRTMLNDWMRSPESGFDGIIDFESVVADPNDPTKLLKSYSPGDGLHPYKAYDKMADAIDLSLFE